MNQLVIKFILVFLLPFYAFAQHEIRYALVIGNKDYPKEIGVLKNSVNDALAISDELKKSDFDVQLVLNASYNEIREAVKIFYDKLNQGPREQVVGLFYYAGHGLQYEGENYIVPVDAKVNYEDDIVRYCFPIQKLVLSNMERAQTRMNILILDACRNNPFPSATRSIGNNGLAEMKTGFGSFIAYATAPGSVAADGLDKNGLYTQELLKAMRVPGLLIEQVFKEVRRNVLRLSGERQYTWDSSNIIGDFYFIPGNQKAAITDHTFAKNEAQPKAGPENEGSRELHKKVVAEDLLGSQLGRLTDQSISFGKRKTEKQNILNYFVVPYATVNIMMNNRIDERITASKLLDRLVTLPKSELSVVDMETSDSGRIIELSIEFED